MIGGVCYAIGLFMRLPFGSNPDRLSLYIIMNMFTVLSPCAFIATVYMLLGRLALHLDADEYLLVKARIITKLFLTSDIGMLALPYIFLQPIDHEYLPSDLLIQAAGGGMAAMQSLKDVGKRVFVVTWPPLYLTRYGHVDSIDTAVEMGVSRDMEK
ncbi:RTA1-like protein [Rhizoctonia solani]|uniref:RTA1-like protein n=1 Tax=Rhizoctonia solani TaxID=456999 RepID=A0A8H8SWX4_9AGAM|nr:RTA1-like protein [Rhizoctonia solani]QRW20979.1 RTA1-like protein [Rhizoctonia solani]